MSWCSRSPTPHSASTLPIDIPADTSTSLPDDDMPIQSRGGYAIDFDNLDSINPFQSSGKMLTSPPKPAALLSDTLIPTETLIPPPPASSPAPEEEMKVSEKADAALDETLPFIPSVENSLADLSADGASTDSTVIIELRKTPLSDHNADETVEVPEPAPVVNEDATDSLVLLKGSYQINFDDLDLVNPFKTGGSKIQNSPPVSRKSPAHDSAPPKAEETSSGAENETPREQEDKLCPTEEPSLTEGNPDSAGPSAAPPKEAPVVLEFNFDDGAEVKRKPPPKRLGLKRPPLSKSKTDATKPASAPSQEKKSPEIEPTSCESATDDAAAEIPPARGAYSIDFHQLDDPNFNPFGTKAKMGSDASVVSEVSTSETLRENRESAPENHTHRSVR